MGNPWKYADIDSMIPFQFKHQDQQKRKTR